MEGVRGGDRGMETESKQKGANWYSTGLMCVAERVTDKQSCKLKYCISRTCVYAPFVLLYKWTIKIHATVHQQTIGVSGGKTEPKHLAIKRLTCQNLSFPQSRDRQWYPPFQSRQHYRLWPSHPQ